MSLPRTMWAPFGQEFATYAYGLGQNAITVGQKMELPDGRVFRFGQVGGVTVAAGKLNQGQVAVSNHILQTPTAASANATSVTVALGATSVDFNEYEAGVLVPELGTGQGYVYAVADRLSNQAASASFAVGLQTGYGVQVAIPATANSVSLIASPWKNTVVVPATLPTATIAGVVQKPLVTAGTIHATGGNAFAAVLGQWGWYQVSGLATCQTDNTSVVTGQPAIASTVTAGNVSLVTTTNVITSPIVGIFSHIATSTNFSTVFLLLQ